MDAMILKSNRVVSIKVSSVKSCRAVIVVFVAAERYCVCCIDVNDKREREKEGKNGGRNNRRKEKPSASANFVTGAALDRLHIPPRATLVNRIGYTNAKLISFDFTRG